MSSTVQDILDLMEYRIDYQGDLYHLINQSIRLIAKRLYLFNSGILKADLTLTFPGPVTYTASTISFDATVSPNLIKDSANHFITAGLTATCKLETNGTGNSGPFTPVTVAAGTITLQASDAVTTAIAGPSVTITELNQYVALPGDFWGLSTGPEDDIYIDNRQWILLPLPERAAALLYPSSGQPVYYEVLGTNFYVYPAADEVMTIKGKYFAKPALVTAKTSPIPFNEEFDDVIADYTVAAYKGEPMKTLQAMVFDAVDAITIKRDKSTASEPKQVIEWDRVTRGW